MHQHESKVGQRLRTAARVLLAASLLIGAVVVVRSGWGDRYLGTLTEQVRGLGPVGPLLFSLAYLPVTLLLVPTGPLSMAAGYLFGWGTGFVIGTVARGLGSTATLVVARFLARPLAERMARRMPRFELLREAVDRGGFEIVVLMRLAPAVPFPVISYSLGLTRLGIGRFTAASLLGGIPSAAIYAWLGTRAPDAVALLRSPGGWRDPRAAAATAAIILLTLLGIWVAGRRLTTHLERLRAEAAVVHES